MFNDVCTEEFESESVTVYSCAPIGAPGMLPWDGKVVEKLAKIYTNLIKVLLEEKFVWKFNLYRMRTWTLMSFCSVGLKNF